MTDSEKISPIDALRVARVILDGASPEWAAKRYGVTVEQVHAAATFVAYRLSRHFRQRGHAPFSLENAPQEHIDEILAVLVSWIDDLALPALPPKAED